MMKVNLLGEAIRGKRRLNIETFTHCIMMPSSAPGKGDLFLFRQIQFSAWCTKKQKKEKLHMSKTKQKKALSKTSAPGLVDPT